MAGQPVETPAVEGAPEVSKKGAKKAAAAAAKAAEKAKKAAEREQAQGSSAAKEDYATANYGQYDPLAKYDGERIVLKNLGEEHVGKTIRFSGFLQNVRKQGAKMAFLELRESGLSAIWTVQALVVENPETVSRQMVKWATTLTAESYVVVQASVQKPDVPIKSTEVKEYELQITKLYLSAAAPTALGMTLAAANLEPTLPTKSMAGMPGAQAAEQVTKGVEDLAVDPSTAGKAGSTMEVHLNNTAVHKRGALDKAIKRIRYNVEKSFRDWLDEHDFMNFHSPLLLSAASEGGAGVFEVKYFETKAYLAQSPQFYKQLEIAGGAGKVYTIGPVFRAEKSNTPRHMTEFIGLDLEMEIKDHYHEVMHTLEEVLLHMIRGIEENCKRELEIVRAVYPSEPFLLPKDGEVLCLKFADAQKLLREEGPAEFKDVKDDEDMSTPQEKALGALVREKYKTDFYVIDKFPSLARPFYTMPDPENPAVTNAYDFFMRGQEILSGGQRLHLADDLVKRMKALDTDPEQDGLKEYVDGFRKVGVPPHGGGGIGLDRIVAWYLALPSIHLVTDYVRTPSRLLP